MLEEAMKRRVLCIGCAAALGAFEVAGAPPTLAQGPAKPAVSASPIPIGDVGSLITTSDFLNDALSHYRAGVSVVTMVVGKDGHPVGCDLFDGWQPATVKQAVCDLLKSRAHFQPAVDGKGQPVVGEYAFSITWWPASVKISESKITAGASTIATQPPKPLSSPGSWISTSDYPVRSFLNGVKGLARFRLIVGADGVPNECEIVASAGDAGLDNTTCGLVIKRARFTPATDTNGKPVTGTYSGAVNWTVPQEFELVPATFDTLTSFDVLPDGKVANCQTAQTGTMPLKFAPSGCDEIQQQYAPPKWVNHKPVKKHVEIEMHIHVTDAP